MKPDVKELWCQALESGDWEQTRGVLCERKEGEPDHYCCWGVLTELSGVVKGINSNTNLSFRSVKAYHGMTFYPPKEVLEWAGFTTENVDQIVQPLAQLNDSGASFKVIAQHIRENY